MCVDANASQDAVGRLDHSGSSLRVDSGDGRVRQASSTSSSRATHEGNNASGASTTGSDPGEDRIGRSVLRGLIAIGGGECHLRLKAGCLAPASSLGHSCPQDVSTYIGIYPQATCTIPGVPPHWPSCSCLDRSSREIGRDFGLYLLDRYMAQEYAGSEPTSCTTSRTTARKIRHRMPLCLRPMSR